jgi:hypothetical protein
MEARLTMSNREIDRLKVINTVMNKQLTWEQAANQLSLSERQIGRICARIRSEGNKGIIHRLRGKESNHKLDPDILTNALNIVSTRYHDFGPTFANEKLSEVHGITISTFALRKGMIAKGLWRSHKQHPKHRQWRQRRACIGELIQLDGSDHDWFEGRGPRCALLVFIDDATGLILYAEFVTVEDAHNLLSAAKSYLLKHGRPVALYVDKDSIYKINRQATVEEQLRDDQPLTQFARAANQLGIEIIFANSPQAKGRVERSFKTHQDRLVKELRLANISNIKSGNLFLKNVYIPAHNSRFAVKPVRSFNAHKPILKSHNLDEILSIQSQRTLLNDFTLRFNNCFLQVLPDQKIRLRPKSKILVQHWLDGSIHLKFKDNFINFKTIKHKPYKPFYAAYPSALKALTSTPPKPYKPSANHPWKRLYPKSKQLSNSITSFKTT